MSDTIRIRPPVTLDMLLLRPGGGFKPNATLRPVRLARHTGGWSVIDGGDDVGVARIVKWEGHR